MLSSKINGNARMLAWCKSDTVNGYLTLSNQRHSDDRNLQ